MATKNIRIDFSGLSYTDSSTFTVSDNTGVSFTGITKAQLTAGYPFEAGNTATEVVVRCTGGNVCLNTEASGAITPEATVTPTPTVTTAPPTDTPTPTPTGTIAGPTDTPTPTVTTAPPTDTPTPTPSITPVPDTYYRFTNCVTSAFVFQTNGISTEPDINSRWTDGFEPYIYGGVSTTLPGSPIVTYLTGPIGTDCYDEATNTPTPAPGTCQFVFVEDTVDTTNKGLQYNLGGEVKTPFPMIGTVTNIGGTDGVVYGICTTTTPQWWDTATNTLTPLPAGVSLLASGGQCQADSGCTYEAPTPTPTTPVTDTPTPTPQITYYIFDACDGGETVASAISTPLDANLQYVDFSGQTQRYFTYTAQSTTNPAGFTINNNLQPNGNTNYGCPSEATPTPTPPPPNKYTISPSPSVSITSNGSDDSTFTITVTQTVNLKGTMTCNTGTGTGTLLFNVPGVGNVTTGQVQYTGSGTNDTGTITLSPGTYANSTLTLTGSGAQGLLQIIGNIFEA